MTRLGLEPGTAPAADAPAAPIHAQASLALDDPGAPYDRPTLITDLPVLQDWLAAARTAGLFALMTAIGADRALLGIALATAPGRAAYVPLAHVDADSAPVPGQLPLADVLPLLAPLLTDPAVLKISHDAKASLRALLDAGAPALAPVDDPQLMSYALDAGAHPHGLEELSRLHLGHTPLSLDETTGTGRARLPFAQVALDRATAYAAQQADVALRLWLTLKPRLRPNRALALYEQMERRLIPVLAAMEQTGILVDADELRRLSLDLGTRMAAMEADIIRAAGRPFNLGSAKQLGEILFDELNLPGAKRLPGGTWSTDASVLQTLR